MSDTLDTLEPPEADVPALPASVLRILGGRLAGKEYPLTPGTRISIGHSLASDVVLRGGGTRDRSVELRPGEEGASVHVLAGEIELLGRALREGEEAVLPPYLPFRFGEFVLAHGAQASDRWEEAERFAASPSAAPLTPLPVPKVSDRIAVVGRSNVKRAFEWMSRPRVAIASASLVLLMAAVQPVQQIVSDVQGQPSTLERQLDRKGFKGFDVTENPAGGLVVHGAVASDNELVRLRALVAQRDAPVVLDVQTASALANAAADVLQAQGVKARTEPSGVGGVVVTAAYLPADKQDALRKLLARDVPGLKRVRFKTDDALGDDALQAYFAGSGAGIASVVEDPGYIATADGSRWFPGAVLPTGHRLVAVQGGLVQFEKDGRIEELHL